MIDSIGSIVITTSLSARELCCAKSDFQSFPGVFKLIIRLFRADKLVF